MSDGIERHGETAWVNDYSNVWGLGRWLVESCKITDIQDLLYYFEKPSKWTTEWHEMQAELAASK